MTTRHRLAGSAFATLSVALFLAVLAALAAVLVAAVPAHALEDGVYQVDARVLKASSDDLSVADAAFEKPLALVEEDEKSYLVADVKPVGSAGLTGYLGFLWYFPDEHGNVLGADAEAVAVLPQGSYDVVDAFNASGGDAAVEGLQYPKRVAFEVDASEPQTWIQVYVPLVEGLSAGSGTQRARLVVDYGSAVPVEDAPTAESARASVASLQQAELSGYRDVYGKLVQARMALLEKRSQKGSGDENGKKGSESGKKAGKSGSSGSGGRASSGKSSSRKAARKLDFAKLPDGTYTVYGEMVKTDRRSSSVSNDAIDHSVRLRVKNGRYTVELTFKAMSLAGKDGALGRLWYFKSGYRRGSSGAPQGAVAPAKVLSRLSLDDGESYPKRVSFPLIAEAKSDGWVPLRVYVPIIESISKGAGVQEVYLKLDKSTLVSGAKAVARSTGGSGTTAAAQGSASGGDASLAGGGGNSSGNSTLDALIGDAGEGDGGAKAVEAKGAQDGGAASGAASASGAAANAGAADGGDREPPLRRYIGLIVGVPALVVFLYCAYVLFTRRGQIRLLGRSRP